MRTISPIFLLAALLVGCGSPTKRVTIRSAPPGANVSVRLLDDAGGVGPSVPLDGRRTPVTASLPVDRNQRYLAVADAPQHLPASVEIERDPESKQTYDLPLRRHLADTTAFELRPERVGDGWVMNFAAVTVPAYVLAADDGGRRQSGSLESDLDLTQITRNDDPNADLLAPAASPAGDLLLVQRVERAAGPAYISQVYKQPTAGGPMSPLTRQRGVTEATPAFDVAGSDAYYAANTTGPNLTLWRTDVAGGGTRRVSVTGGTSLDWNPSVGGPLLAYSSLPGRRADARPQLWTADAATAGNLALVVDGAESPAVSPDGRRICFVELVDLPATAATPARRVRRLATINADGSQRTQLTANNDYDVRDPAWSPDGKQIVFAADGPGTPTAAPRGDLGALAGVPAPPADAPRNFDLYVLRLDDPAAEPARLTSNLSADTDPCFGRGGERVYFRSNRGGRWNLWSIDVPAEPSRGG